jgi:threonine aldolase
VLGGGMRQVGVLAAAGQYALDHHVDRLAEDHANAQVLAKSLVGIPGLEVDEPSTNMVWVRVAKPLEGLASALEARGVLTTGTSLLRLVLHLDVSREQTVHVAQVIRECVEALGRTPAR